MAGRDPVIWAITIVFQGAQQQEAKIKSVARTQMQAFQVVHPNHDNQHLPNDWLF